MTDIGDNECAQWWARVLAADADTDAAVSWLTGFAAPPHTAAIDDRARVARALMHSLDAQLHTALRLVVAAHATPQLKPKATAPIVLVSLQERMQARAQQHAAPRRIMPMDVPHGSSSSSSSTSQPSSSSSSSSSASAAAASSLFRAADVSEFVPASQTARSIFLDAANESKPQAVNAPSPLSSSPERAATPSSSSAGSAAVTGVGVESLTIASVAPPLDAAESAMILRLARVFSCLLLFGVSNTSVLHDFRAVVSVLRSVVPPLVRACTATPTDADGAPTPLWCVALLRGGERCAAFACATLSHARRLLFALDSRAQLALGAIPALRAREPALCDALLRSGERAQQQQQPKNVVSHAVRPPQAASHVNVDDCNRNQARAPADQATYNNRERQRDDFLKIQSNWLAKVAADKVADDGELLHLAVDELSKSVRLFVSNTDLLNLAWLGTMLRDQLLAAAIADPRDEDDVEIKATGASRQKLRDLRGRIEGARGVAGAMNSPHGGAARAKVPAVRRRSFARLFVAPARSSAALSFVYEFAEAALHEGGHLYTALVGVLASRLLELLQTSGADGAATRHDLPALSIALARQTGELCALARFLGFVQALPFFHLYPQTGGDAVLLGGVAAVDAMAWPVRPAQCIEAARRNGTLSLTLPWACALLVAWRNERAMSQSRIVRETIDALRAVLPSEVLRSRELSLPLSLPRVFALHTLVSTFADIGESVDMPPMRAPGAVEQPPRDGAASPEGVVSPLGAPPPSRATPDDFGDLLDDDFVQLYFKPLDKLVNAALRAGDADGGADGARGSSSSRPTKKITLTPTAAAPPRAVAPSDQETLRGWFVWQHRDVDTLAKAVSSSVARSALAFIDDDNAEVRGEIARVRAKLMARVAIGDSAAQALFEQMVLGKFAAVVAPAELKEFEIRVRHAITAFVERRVREALTLLLPATQSDNVLRAAITHTLSLTLSMVLDSGVQRAARIVRNVASNELNKAARCHNRDTPSWSEAAPTIVAAIDCLYAATLLFEPSDAACLEALHATRSTNPVLCERIRALARVADADAGAPLRCVAAAIDALLRTLETEQLNNAEHRDRDRWQPLLPRATLALGEAVAHAVAHAGNAQQATAICALARLACTKVAVFDRRLVSNVYFLLADARHVPRPRPECVQQLLDTINCH